MELIISVFTSWNGSCSYVWRAKLHLRQHKQGGIAKGLQWRNFYILRGWISLLNRKQNECIHYLLEMQKLWNHQLLLKQIFTKIGYEGSRRSFSQSSKIIQKIIWEEKKRDLRQDYSKEFKIKVRKKSWSQLYK